MSHGLQSVLRPLPSLWAGRCSSARHEIRPRLQWPIEPAPEMCNGPGEVGAGTQGCPHPTPPAKG